MRACLEEQESPGPWIHPCWMRGLVSRTPLGGGVPEWVVNSGGRGKGGGGRGSGENQVGGATARNVILGKSRLGRRYSRGCWAAQWWTR